MTRALYVLLGAVALAAAVLSFAALRDLAILCGFGPKLAWLLPVVVDAGAAGGSLVWLGDHAPTQARRFAQRLALTLLGLSISANALGHVLAQAGGPAPAWAVAVASGAAPAVLAALIHLGVLCGRTEDSAAPKPQAEPRDEPTLAVSPAGDEPAADVADPGEPGEQAGEDRAAELIAAGVGRRVLARELQIPEHKARELLATRRNGHRAEAGG